MSETIRVNISVSPELHTFFKEQARRAGVSMSAMMSVALLQYKDSYTAAPSDLSHEQLEASAERQR